MEVGKLVSEEEVMLPGFRFHPTDEELVGFYLRRKVDNKPISIEVIKHIDIYKYDPWDLPKVSTVGDKEWYFFCIRGRKYRNSIRPNRVTGSGFWKATGIDKPIYSSSKQNHQEHIGLKKSLVYYKGSAGKGTKTDWMMHEFRLPPNPRNVDNKDLFMAQEAEVWTLCRIFKRIPSYKKYIPLKPTTTPTTSSSSETTTNHQYIYDSKPFVNHHQFNPSSTFTTTANLNGSPDDFFVNGNWDELRSVVDFANLHRSHNVYA